MSEALSALEKVRINVIKLHGKGVTKKAIARQLKIDVRTVRNTIERFDETGSVRDRARLGRKKKNHRWGSIAFTETSQRS